MYTYLLNNGGEYIDYGIVAIVQSDTPIDWPELKRQFVARLSGRQFFSERKDGTQWETWYLPDDVREETFVALGVKVIDYEEISFDVRRAYDDNYNAIPGEWKVSE